MGFFAPVALLALPLLAVIIALYLLRMRSPSAPIAGLQHWDDLKRDREANALWQRLQASVLLVLQIAALLALIVALARPWTQADASTQGNIVVIIDLSASMSTLDGDDRGRTSRLDAAKAQALSLVENLQQGSAALISAGSQAAVVVPRVTDKARLRAAIQALEWQNSGANMVAALKLAGALASQQPQTVVWVLSDGRFGSTAEQVGQLNAQLHFFPVGCSTRNQAISALSLSQVSGDLKLFIQVYNAQTITVTRRIDLALDDVPWNARTLTLSPGAAQELVLDNVPDASRIVKAALSGTDDMPADDNAWAVNRAAVPANILLVTNGNKFLESALSILPGVSLYKVPPAAYDPNATVDKSPVDLTVFDADVFSTTLQALPAGNLLLVGPSRSCTVIEVTGVFTNPTPLVQLTGSASSDRQGNGNEKESEALLRFVDLGSVHIARAYNLRVPAWGRVALNSDKGPLIVAGEQAGRQVGVLAFDLRDTDLPLQTAFPLLIRNLIRTLLPTPSGGLPAVLSPRSAVTIKRQAQDVDRILVEDPNGRDWTYPLAEGSDQLTFAETNYTGIYYVTQYAGESISAQEGFSVNLFSRDESNIAPVTAPSLPQGIPPSAQVVSGGAVAQREVWPLVALWGLAILIIEWLYAQRMAVRRALTEARARRALRRVDRI